MTDIKSPLPGVNILLMGPTGVGKTTSLKTLISCGITPMAIFTEPGFEVLGDVPADKFHWKYVCPVQDSLDTIINKATSVATMTYKSQTEVYDAERNRDNRFLEIIKTMNDFKCDRTSQSFGPIKSWGTDRALIIDSLSGMALAAKTMVAGKKPALAPADWGQIQEQLEGPINWCCYGLRCHFILLAHIDRETDEVLGGSKIMPAIPGKKYAPRIGNTFSDVILAQRSGKEFKWSTAAPGADLKARNLPVAEGLAPSFVQVIDSWQSRGGIIEKGAIK